MSYKIEVLIPPSEWGSNALRFETKEEAIASGRELLSRWMLPIDNRATESTDPVNYKFNFETNTNERIGS